MHSPEDNVRLDKLQRDTFQYFVHEANPANGLVPDSTKQDTAASIAAVGLGLTAYAIGAERGFVSRNAAVARVLTTLQFFWHGPQGPDEDAIGYHGFYYHFLDMESGRRAWKSEISTIDSAYLLAGALTVAAYFDRDNAEEREIRELAEGLYRRADWHWAQNGGLAVSHGWTPQRGFIRYRWQGYSEALILYVLGLASPTFPLPAESYTAWTKTYKWKRLYGYDLLYAAPLFIHQLSHVWIDFRGIQDAPMRAHHSDYFANSGYATHVQQQYAIRNTRGFRGYGEWVWGITASDGPGPASRKVDGRARKFRAYLARGIPNGPDDGTVAPWAVVASLPFAPEIVLPTIAYLNEHYPSMSSKYGFKCSFNPTFPADHTGGWTSEGYYGLDQGPIVMMIENYRSGWLWDLLRRCEWLTTGLRRAGFSGGWLDTTWNASSSSPPPLGEAG
ncbi:MAG: hypothetical protein DLM69_04905 [Candidatus Chloroheliales bacterium]|nr:MAG: hypothetical protein DLM69_04905 [Chloroflexota bacterium]